MPSKPIDNPVKPKLDNITSTNNVIPLLRHVPIHTESRQKLRSMYTTNPLSISSSLIHLHTTKHGKTF